MDGEVRAAERALARARARAGLGLSTEDMLAALGEKHDVTVATTIFSVPCEADCDAGKVNDESWTRDEDMPDCEACAGRGGTGSRGWVVKVESRGSLLSLVSRHYGENLNDVVTAAYARIPAGLVI